MGEGDQAEFSAVTLVPKKSEPPEGVQVIAAAALAAEKAAKEAESAAESVEAEEKVVSFEVEVVSYEGLQLPPHTVIEISGFCDTPVASDELETTDDPPKWTFQGANTGNFAKILSRGSKLNTDLVQEMTSKHLLLTISNTASKQAVGTAKFTLEGLIHDSTSKSMVADVEWEKDFISNFLAEQAAAQGGEAGSEEKEASQEEPGSLEPQAPEPGHLVITVTIDQLVGKALAPMDYEDWVVLTVKNEGIFSLPTKLQDLNPTAISDAPPGHIADHPLVYSVRVLGCAFDGGKLVKPEVEEEEGGAGERSQEGVESPKPQASVEKPPTEGEEEGRERAGTLGSQAGSVGTVTGGSGKAVQQQQGVTYDKFIDGLTRSGYPNAPEDGAELWGVLNKANNPTINLSDWIALGEIGVPADRASVLSFREWILEKYSLLKDAFDAMDSESKGTVSEEEFLKTLDDLEYAKPDGKEIFGALDLKREGYLTWEDFQCLHLFKALDKVERVGNVKKWLHQNVGPMMKCMQVIDDNNSGRVSKEEWDESMHKTLKYPEPEDAKIAFDFMDVGLGGVCGPNEFKLLEKFDAKGFLKELTEFQVFLKSKCGDCEKAFQDLAGGEGDPNLLTGPKWKKGMKRLGYKSPTHMDLRIIFNFLDEKHNGFVSKGEFMLLRAFNASAAKGGLARIKNFFTSRYAELADAYNVMFGDPSEFFKTAETKMARIEFDTPEVRTYRGRAWLQHMMNTVGDSRGRKLAKISDAVIGGSWAYFFPKPVALSEELIKSKGGLGGLVDYKDSPDVDLARAARWHHAQTFIDLRKLKEDHTCTTLELRCFLSQVGSMPKEMTEEAANLGLPKGPFESCRSYVKLTISFDRQIEHLCPRNISDLPTSEGGAPFIPGAPEKAPPPTVLEEFELQVRSIVGKLTEKFALQCLHQGLEQSQIVGPKSQVSQYLLLGKGLDRGQFLLWLRSAQQGKLWEDLATALRPAAVKVIRDCASDGPASGLYGNDKDAKYSELRDLFMTHIMKAINTDITLQGYRREAKTWMNPPLFGDGDENLFEKEDLAIQRHELDKKLKRLCYECELYGEFERATRLWGKRLDILENKEDFDLWVQYARFLMRTQRMQREADEALRYAISLVSLEKADVQAVLFLACIMMNRSLPCSVPDEPRDLRFQSAVKLLTVVTERDPTDRVANFFMYLTFAVEAAETEDPKTASNYSLVASKYLALSKSEDAVFTGTLPSLDEEGDPYFPELEDLHKREMANRATGEQAHHHFEVPPAWQSALFPVFPEDNAAHLMPSRKDEIALNGIDRLLLFGMPIFSRYLLLEAGDKYGFVSKDSLESERCQLQLVKTRMMLGQYNEAIERCEKIFGLTDRTCEAHLLLAESYFRKALEAPVEEQKPLFDLSLETFHKALAFLNLPKDEVSKKKQDVEVKNQDPVIHMRMASVYYMRAEESKFTDFEVMLLAKEHYKRSLLLCPTAEAWRNSGVCAYRMAVIKKAAGLTEEEDVLYNEALECLTQANLMDETRPKINVWLTVCAVELGKSTIAQQAFRQAMAKEDELDFDTAMELAQALLRFSDIKNAEAEGGSRFVRPGLYAREALLAAKAALMKKDSGEAHFIIGQALMMLGEDKEAMGELRGAIAWFYDQPERQQLVAEVARNCAARIIDEPRMMEVVDEDLQMATERRRLEAAQ